MSSVLKFGSSRIRMAQHFETSAEEMVRAVRQQGLEGVVAKRKDSRYEAGKRSGSWAKYRLNRGQELVIGGYVSGAHGLDSIIVGYTTEKRNWFTSPESGTDSCLPHEDKFSRGYDLWKCRTVHLLPEKYKGRWGDGLTVEDMEKCVWVRPELVARIEFLEWTQSDHLRHAKFAGLRQDKSARSVVKEDAEKPDQG